MVTCYYDNVRELPALLDLHEEGIDLFRFRLFRPNHESQEAQALDRHRALANETFVSLRALANARRVLIDTPPPFAIPSLIDLSRSARAARASKAAQPTPSRAAVQWICHFPFETASIFSDGRVSPCCEEIFLGQLHPKKPEIEKLFRGAAWRELRRQVAEGDFRGKCVECEFRRSLDQRRREAESAAPARPDTPEPE